VPFTSALERDISMVYVGP